MLPSEALTSEERVELARLAAALEAKTPLQREALAELLMYRRLQKEIRAMGYLMRNRAVRALLDRMPGSRTVPAAHLPPYNKR